MKLIIGNKNYSSWSLRPWLLMSVNGIDFEEIRILLDTATTQATLSAYTEARKVPVLHDGGLVVWDSLAICEYLSEQYLQGRGWPEAPAARAEARSCSAEMHAGFPELRRQLPMNCRAMERRVPGSPELEEEIQRIDAIWSTLRKKYADRGPWLFGEFSIADCMFAPVVFRFRTYGILLSSTATDYLSYSLAHEKMLLWTEQARQEKETIIGAELGLESA